MTIRREELVALVISARRSRHRLKNSLVPELPRRFSDTLGLGAI